MVFLVFACTWLPGFWATRLSGERSVSHPRLVDPSCFLTACWWLHVSILIPLPNVDTLDESVVIGAICTSAGVFRQ